MDVDTAQRSLFTLAAIRAVTVRVSREFHVPSERLFDAWRDAASRDRFLPIACGDAAQVTCIEIDAPHRVVFDVRPYGQARPDDRVTIELAPLERGTLLVLIYETGLHRASERANIEAAWHASLLVLEACL